MIPNILCRLFGSLVIIIFLSAASRAVVIATVPVGSPGNSADPTTGSLYGAVPYSYRIGTYDVTNAQYVEFLNAKASTADPYGLWNTHGDPSNFVPNPISRTGAGPYTYAVAPSYANKPVTYVSWYDAVRFANWLTNGQGAGDTENGTYTITNGGSNSGTVLVPDALQRAAWALTNSVHWLLPSEDEWYKGAYYNTTTATYWGYPFQSDSQPAALAPPGNTNSGNFFGGIVNGHPLYPAFNYDGNGAYSTDVGAYSGSLSPFGELDMGGDVLQWDEVQIGSNRGVRGGDWFDGPPSDSASSRRRIVTPFAYADFVGFRVTSVGGVPEPATVIMVVIGFVGLPVLNTRRRAGSHRFRNPPPARGDSPEARRAVRE
jgi:sulfatase modifying factor 1